MNIAKSLLNTLWMTELFAIPSVNYSWIYEKFAYFVTMGETKSFCWGTNNKKEIIGS